MFEHWREPNVAVGLLGAGAASVVAGVVLLAASVGVDDRFAYVLVAGGTFFVAVGGVLLSIGPKKKPEGTPSLMHGDGNDGNALGAQGDIRDSNVSQTASNSNAVTNQGTMQVGTIHVGDVHPPAAQSKPPSAWITVAGRVCYLYVRNNDTTEDFVVEVAGFTKGVRLRLIWDNGQETRTLKRGETAGLKIMCVEPDRPHASLSLVDRLAAPYVVVPWKKRIENRVRIVRFFGATHSDVQAPINSPWSFVVTILSDHHDPVVQNYTYAVTDDCALLIPFDQGELNRLNALGTPDRDALIRWCESLDAKDEDAE